MIPKMAECIPPDSTKEKTPAERLGFFFGERDEIVMP